MVLASDPPMVLPEGGKRIEIRQGGLRVMQSRHPEILLEGPAGTGKTFFLVWYAHMLCEIYPGVRIYFVRQTRKSLNESAMSLYEDLLGWDHQVLRPRRVRASRDKYVYPHAKRFVDPNDGKGPRWFEGESVIYLVGMDNPDRLMSTEGDAAMFFEATEGFLDGWDKLGSRMRRGYLPWNFRVADCNPGPKNFWLNLRADEELEIDPTVREQLGDRWVDTTKMLRVKTTLRDNPKYWDSARGEWTEDGLAYKVKLAGLSPVNRLRLEAGEWVSAAGQVYENFSSSVHVKRGGLENRKGYWWLAPEVNKKLGILPDFKERKVAWFGISVDWGFYPDPGVAQLWAFDEANRGFLVKERYEVRVNREDWAEQIVGWQREYDPRAIVCDHDPEQVRLLNEMIGSKVHGGKGVARNADKAIVAGIDVCRWALEPREGEEPHLHFLSGALEHEDQTLREEMRSTSTLAEIGSYVYAAREDGKTYKTDVPDKHCDDHGMDAMRYMMMYAWRHKHKAPEEPTAFKQGTYGHKFDIAGRMRRAQQKRLTGR